MRKLSAVSRQLSAWGKTLLKSGGTPKRAAVLVPARRDFVSFTTRRKLVDLTPQKMLSIFGDADAHLAEQILLAYEIEESDPDLAGTLRVRRSAVRRLQRIVQPGDADDERSVQAAEALDTLVNTGWWGHMEEWLLRAIWHQHASVEVLYEGPGAEGPRGRGAQRWMPTGWRAIEPERYYVDEDLTIKLYRDLQTQSTSDLVALDAGAFLHHSHAAVTGQPGRYALVRTLAKLWYLQHLNLTGWGKLIDKWGQPFTHFQYDPASISSAELTTLVNTFLTLADELVCATPAGVQVDLKDPVEHTPNREFAEFYAKCVSRFLLGQETAQHATAGQETGANLQGQVKDDLRDEDAEALDDTLQTQFIAPWVAWNWGPAVAPPTLRHVAQTVLDQEQRGRVFTVAQTLGLPIKKEQVYEELGIETPAEGDELLVAPAAQSVPAAAAVDDVAFEKRMLELLGSGQMTREMIANLLDVQEMIKRVGLPLYNQGKGGDAEPWLPILAPAGGVPVTGDVKRDEEGDIVGGEVDESLLTPGGAPGAAGLLGLSRRHPEAVRHVGGRLFLVQPQLLAHVIEQPLAGGGEALTDRDHHLKPEHDSPSGGAVSRQPSAVSRTAGTETGRYTSALKSGSGLAALVKHFEARSKAVQAAAEGAVNLDDFRGLLGELLAAPPDDGLVDELTTDILGALALGRLEVGEKLSAVSGQQSATGRAQPSPRPHVPTSPRPHVPTSPPITALAAAGDGVEDVSRARFREAIDALAQRTDLLPKEEFLKLQGQARAKAWTVARVADMAIMKDLHGAVGQAVEGGQTWREFKDGLDSIMEQRGWSGLKPWHARTVYEQNVMMAHAAGRVTQARDAGLSHWRKLRSRSANPRPEHERYNDHVFAFSEMSPPPWDFGCKCEWEPLFDDEVDRKPTAAPRGSADLPPGATEFEFNASDYFRPLELRRGDYPAELWPVIRSIASEANALLKVRD